MATTINMKDLTMTDGPFEDYGVGSDAYVPIDDVLNRELNVYAVKEFENDKGAGVFILVKEPMGDFRYICTHSVTITSKFTSKQVKEALAQNNATVIAGRFIKRKSQKSDRMVYDFI